MNENFVNLFKKFNDIKKIGWIRSLRKGYTGIGYTFEALIGKSEDSLPTPDFKNIEIKTMRKYSKRKIHLFSTFPDGECESPMKRVLYKLGYPDKKNNDVRVFNMDFNAINYTKIGYYRMGKIEIDYKNKKILLVARDYLGNDLKINTSWSFNLLKDRLYMKLKELVIVEAEAKTINNIEFFQYNRISYYKLRDFDSFIDLIDKGIIDIGFKIGYKKDKDHFGEYKSRGTVFSISMNNLEKLYKKVPLELFEYQLI